MSHLFRSTVVLALSLAGPAALACEGESHGSCAMKGASDATAAAQGSLPTGATVATMSLSGMECGSCALKLRGALEAVPGVTAAIVNYDTKTAQVAYDPAKTTTAALQAAVSGAGHFTATPQGV